MTCLDTDRKFHVTRESPTETSLSSIEVMPMKDGKVQIIAEQSTKKWDGKRWHTSLVIFSLDAEQAAKLREALA